MKPRNIARIYMSPADDKGGDLGGAAAIVDRGDGVAVVDTSVADAAAAAATAAAEVAAAEAAARDDKGRFKKDEGDVKDVKDVKDDKKMIPKARFDEQVAKERARTIAAEARAAALEQQIAQVAHNEDTAALDKDIVELSDKLEAARLDGDKKAVKDIASELRSKERQLSLAENTRMSAAAKDQAREEIRLDLTIEKLEQLHPMLNENDKESYDQDVVDMVLATQRDLIARDKLSPSKALEEATRKVMLKVMPAHREAATDDKEKGGLKDAEGKAAGDRKEAQVKKNIDTATKQPASMKESGVDGDKLGQSKTEPSASEMTYEEFSALPEATKAKMRGDVI